MNVVKTIALPPPGHAPTEAKIALLADVSVSVAIVDRGVVIGFDRKSQR